MRRVLALALSTMLAVLPAWAEDQVTDFQLDRPHARVNRSRL